MNKDNFKNLIKKTPIYRWVWVPYRRIRKNLKEFLMRVRILRNRLRKKLVLEIRYGGLGDHLFYSHLPRIAKETGAYKRVFISNFSIYRDEEIRRLVWETNPYIDGFCNERGTYPNVKGTREGYNLLDEMMVLHHVDDGARFHEPELYFKPTFRKELEDKIVYDPNYGSNAGDSIQPSVLENFFKNNNIHVDMQIRLRKKHVEIANFDSWLESSSLEDFCGILYSCKQVYCLATGTATLCSALKKPATVFYQSRLMKMFLHSNIHKYVKLI